MEMHQLTIWGRSGFFLALVLWTLTVFFVYIGTNFSSSFFKRLTRFNEEYRNQSITRPIMTEKPEIQIFFGNNASKDSHYNKQQEIENFKSILNGKSEHFRDRFNKSYYSTRFGIGKNNVSNSSKYLIYRCDASNMRLCGGWADRVKGMMTAYIIANLTGRIFKLEVLSPSCALHQNLVPNHVNWSLPKSFHHFVKKSPDVQVLNYVNNVMSVRRMRHLDLQSLPQMQAKYVYFKSNLDYMVEFRESKRYQKQISWMKGLTRDQINAAIFRRLFKLSPLLHSKIRSFLENHLDSNSNLICVHVRCGANPSIPHDTVIRIGEEALPKLWNFLQLISNSSYDKIFLMSDSENVLASAKRQSFQDKIFATPGKILHIERTRHATLEERCLGLDKVILEQFVLMHCDTLVVSKSGLSRMAAYVRGSDKGLFCLMEDGSVLPCKKKDIQKVYGVLG